MAKLEVISSGLRGGIWHATVHGSGRAAPPVSVLLRGEPVHADLALSEKGDHWLLTMPIPPDAIEEGLQTFVISDDLSGETLASFAVLAGQALGDDLRAEVDLLRAELEMLKRAFRRHCTEGDT